MKVLLRRNVHNLGIIGDMVEVKGGYARNYLLPEGLAVKPTPANLKAVEAEKQQYLAEVAHQRAEMEAKAAAIQGRQAVITARANPEGHLYGSVGPAQIVAAFAEQGVLLEQGNIVVDSPIRQLGRFDVTVRFAPDITAVVHLAINPVEGEAPDEQPRPAAEGQTPAERPTSEEAQ